MAVNRLVYDSRHLQADCQERRSPLESYARQSSMGYCQGCSPKKEVGGRLKQDLDKDF